MRRTLAGLLTAMLGVGAGLSAAQPAAAAAAGCNDVGMTNVRVCLYDSKGWDTADGFWQRDLATVNQTCVNLSRHSWHNGGPVNDAASSIYIKASPVPVNTKFRVRIYDWTNCSSANGYVDWVFTNTNAPSAEGEDIGWMWNDAIGSVQIFVQPA